MLNADALRLTNIRKSNPAKYKDLSHKKRNHIPLSIDQQRLMANSTESRLILPILGIIEQETYQTANLSVWFLYSSIYSHFHMLMIVVSQVEYLIIPSGHELLPADVLSVYPDGVPLFDYL